MKMGCVGWKMENLDVWSMCVCVFEIGKGIDGGDNCLGNSVGDT
jgi:hypothetical protein